MSKRRTKRAPKQRITAYADEAAQSVFPLNEHGKPIELRWRMGPQGPELVKETVPEGRVGR